MRVRRALPSSPVKGFPAGPLLTVLAFSPSRRRRQTAVAAAMSVLASFLALTPATAVADSAPTACQRPVTAIAAGDSHSLAVKDDGTVWAWGNNGTGQLGGGVGYISEPQPVQAAVSGISRVAVGANHSFGLGADGSLWGWGDNTYGQVGSGATQLGPAHLTAITGMTAISGGYSHSLGLRGDGTVWAWGRNQYGQLGNGTTTTAANPTPVQVSGLTGVTAIAGGADVDYSLALKGDGSVWAWGNNAAGQLGDGTTTSRSAPVQVTGLAGVIAISAGSPSTTENGHSLALKSDGTVWAWGYNADGQLGDGTTTNRPTPVQVGGLTGVAAIAAGANHSLALKSDGTVRAWGNGSYGQLGNGAGSLLGSKSPIAVSGLTGVSAVTAGWGHSLALKSDGTVWAWGDNLQGQVGDGTYVNRLSPVQVGGGAVPCTPVTLPATCAATGIVAGDVHSLAVKADGTVWGWGEDNDGQLGRGGVASPLSPQSVPAQTGVSGISTAVAGAWHSFGLGLDGSVWAWGLNNYGQLGDGTITNRSLPVPVSSLTGMAAIGAGRRHSLGVKLDGTVWAWGDNEAGQLGTGTTNTTPNPTPVQVPGLSGVTAVNGATDGNYSLALKSDGTVWTWGSNAFGQLGDGTTTNRSTPVQVSSLTGVVAIAAGAANSTEEGHSLALKADGTVWAWGRNSSGELGNGTTTDRTTPVQVTGLTGVVAIAGGYGHSLALKSDGTVWAWGTDLYGQLGDGANTTLGHQTIPVAVSGLTGVSAIAAGWGHSLALKADGTVWAWGYNVEGSVGDGTFINRSSPVQVSTVGTLPCVPFERTSGADIFANGNGTRTAHIYGGLANWQNETTGAWQPIDTTVVADSTGNYRSASTPVHMSFPAATGQISGVAGSTWLGRLARRDWSIQFDMENAISARAAVATGSTVVYAQVRQGVDLEYSVGPDSLKEFVVLNQPLPAGTAPTFRFPLTLTGVHAETESDGVAFYDTDSGDRVALIPQGYMVDSSGASPADSAWSPITTTLTGTSTAPVIQIQADTTWLADPARVYPVRIDPTFVAGDGNNDGRDAFDSSLNRNATYNNAAQTESVPAAAASSSSTRNGYVNRIGYSAYSSNEHYTYLKFNLDPVAGKQILADTGLYFWTFTKKDPGNWFWIKRAQAPWDDYSVTRNSAVSHGPETKAVSNAAANTQTWVNMADWVTNWASGSWQNNGMVMNTNGQDGYVRIGASEEKYNGFADYPFLVVTYNTRAYIPAGQLSPANGWSGTSAPTLSAGYYDAEGTAGTVDFEISGVGTWSRPASNSSRATYTPTVGPGSYSWHARACDSSPCAGDWSGWQTFTVLANGATIPDSLTPVDYSYSATPPTLSARYTTTDGQPGIVRFEVANVGTFDVAASPNQTVTYSLANLPNGLPDGTYTWRVRGVEGTYLTPWSLSQTFTVSRAVVLSDTFTGTTGAPWDPNKWTKALSGTSAEDLSANRARLYVSGAGDAKATAKSGSLADASVLLSYKFDAPNPADARSAQSGFRVALRYQGASSMTSGYRVEVQSDSKTIKLRRVTAGSVTDTKSFTYTKDAQTQNLRFSVERDLIMVTVWPAGTAEPKIANLVWQDPSPLPTGTLQLHHNGTSGARNVLVDNLVLVDMTRISASSLPFPLWTVDNRKIDYARRDRTFVDPSNSGHPMRTRGWIPDDAINFGAMCVTGSGNFRPECTAQSHAIRKLGDVLVPGGRWDPGDRVQWEVGKTSSDAVCPDQDLDGCEPVTAGGFRVDIVTVPQTEGQALPYGLIEVKHWYPGAPGEVDDQLKRYEDALGTAGLDGQPGVGLATTRDTTLNNLNGGVGWATRYQNDNDGSVWYAWAPVAADQNQPFKSGDTTNFSYGPRELFGGDVYFGTEDETPQAVKNRAQNAVGDEEFHRLVFYSHYAAYQAWKLVNPLFNPIWSPDPPIIAVPGIPV